MLTGFKGVKMIYIAVFTLIADVLALAILVIVATNGSTSYEQLERMEREIKDIKTRIEIQEIKEEYKV